MLLAFTLSRFTDLPFLWLFAVVHLVPVVKAMVGIVLVKRGSWVKNIVSQ